MKLEFILGILILIYMVLLYRELVKNNKEFKEYKKNMEDHKNVSNKKRT